MQMLMAIATPAFGAVDAAVDPGLTLYLETTINGGTQPRLAQFEQRGGELYASAETLRKLGFVSSAGHATDAAIRVAGLPGVTIDYDAARQRLAITAPLSLLDLATLRLNEPEQVTSDVGTSRGMLLNYDLYATGAQHEGSSVNAYAELRAFGAGGTFSNSLVARTYRLPGSDWRGDTVRLNSAWSLSFPQHMLSLIVGDTTTRSLDWTRATYIGGIQLTRDFSLQPYRLTMPLPAFFGEATAPSAIDLYVNGVRQFNGQVPAGPFQLTAIPHVNGIGQAQIVVTDALGRATTIDFPFYSANQLLQRGLSDYSVELGFVRRNFGTTSFDYGHDPVASATLRYGVSDRLTIEGHAEGGAGVINGGGGADLLIGNAGVLSGAYAYSHDGDAHGSLTSLGYDWRNTRFNFSVQSTRTFGDYRDVASDYGRPPARVAERALFGVGIGRAGNIGLSYLRLQYPHEDASRYASAYYSTSVNGNLSFNLSFNQNLDQAEDRNVFLGVVLSARRDVLVSASLQQDRSRTSATLDASHPIPGDGGFGWRAQIRSGAGTNGGLAEAGLRADWGQWLGGVSAIGDSRYVYSDLTGALVLMGGHVFAARRIDDAFAVVSTDGEAGVPVLLENREIGRTNSSGALLVTPLNAYQRNQIAISPLDLPANMRVDRVSAIATPARGAGALVRFDLRIVRGASLILHDLAGTPLPLGSHAHIDGELGASAVVGYDGITYLEGLGEHNVVRVDTPSGICHVRFDYPANASNPTIGPLPCR
jgi:outer membrane usher protein